MVQNPIRENGEFSRYAGLDLLHRPPNLWKEEVEFALRGAKLLQAFCPGRIQYSRYEGVLEELVRQLKMEITTAINSYGEYDEWKLRQ